MNASVLLYKPFAQLGKSFRKVPIKTLLPSRHTSDNMSNQRMNLRTGSDSAQYSILRWLRTLNLRRHFDQVFSMWPLFQQSVTFLFEISDLPRKEDSAPNLDVFRQGNCIIVHHTDITGPNELTPPFHTENAVEAALPNVISTTSGIIVTNQNVKDIREEVMKQWREILIDVALEYDKDAGEIVMTGGDRTERITVD